MKGEIGLPNKVCLEWDESYVNALLACGISYLLLLRPLDQIDFSWVLWYFGILYKPRRIHVHVCVCMHIISLTHMLLWIT